MEQEDPIIFGGDPGKHMDAFGIVVIRVKSKYIEVIGAKQFKKFDYIDVENYFEEKYHELDPVHIVIELNNTGTHVVENLVRMNDIPVIVPVTTSTDLKDIKKIYSVKTMDKNSMVPWLKASIQNNVIRFPKKGSKDMEELKRQISIFASHKTEARHISYRAPGSEHDDMVMALMLACFIGKHYLETNRSKINVVSKKIMPDRNEYDYLGSGIPATATLKQRAVYQP